MVKTTTARTVTRRPSEDMGNQAMVDNMSLLKIHDDGSAVFLGIAIVSPSSCPELTLVRFCFWVLHILSTRSKMDLRKAWDKPFLADHCESST
jgi:hypothetical protein